MQNEAEEGLAQRKQSPGLGGGIQRTQGSLFRSKGYRSGTLDQSARVKGPVENAHGASSVARERGGNASVYACMSPPFYTPRATGNGSYGLHPDGWVTQFPPATEVDPVTRVVSYADCFPGLGYRSVHCLLVVFRITVVDNGLLVMGATPESNLSTRIPKLAELFSGPSVVFKTFDFRIPNPNPAESLSGTSIPRIVILPGPPCLAPSHSGVPITPENGEMRSLTPQDGGHLPQISTLPTRWDLWSQGVWEILGIFIFPLLRKAWGGVFNPTFLTTLFPEITPSLRSPPITVVVVVFTKVRVQGQGEHAWDVEWGWKCVDAGPMPLGTPPSQPTPTTSPTVLLFCFRDTTHWRRGPSNLTPAARG
ncbi:hypothetical protein QBC44DRAFT_395579 [Cladorrhinum sp. PSN332]|nr:hypothetical protein QBC44DRAFT_395579 [Cladorrhinum sp. PSN332]